jgi:hypothetical protein
MTIIYHLYSFFFKINNNKTITNHKNNSNITNVSSGVIYTFINFYLLITLYNFIYFFILKGSVTIIWFNHITINNLFIFLLYFFTIVGFLFYFLLKQVSLKKKIVKSLDFLLSISNLIFLLPYLFCVNTIFTFLFFLELLSTILFYKLLSSKIWYKNNNKNNTTTNNLPQNYINMVFFQYWVTFFSTIFIIYFYINMYGFFGTSDWNNIQYCYWYSDKKNISIVNLNLLLLLFIFSIFIKLGVAPIHLFKIEVYNGLPYITIFFYTTFYFLIFFLFFLLFLLNFLNIFLQQIYFIFIISIFIGVIYTAVLLFDVSYIKAFFAYSTIINSIGFLFVFISSL